MHLETELFRRRRRRNYTCHALMVLYVRRRMKMDKTKQNGDDLKKPCPPSPPGISIQCEVLDLSTKRLLLPPLPPPSSSTPPNSPSSTLPNSRPSSPPNRTRHPPPTSSSTLIARVVESCYSSTDDATAATTTLADIPHRTINQALPCMTTTTGKTETTYSVESTSPTAPTARAPSDDGEQQQQQRQQQQAKDVRRSFTRRHVVDHNSPYSSFAPHQSSSSFHGVSPVAATHHRPPPHFIEMPPSASIGTFPFNAAAVAAAATAAAAVSPFIRGFPGLGQPLLTDGSSIRSLPRSSNNPSHPPPPLHMDFHSAAAATAAAFPSYIQRRRRRGHRRSDLTTTHASSPHLSQHPSGFQQLAHVGPIRATDDDCSRDSTSGRIASSRNSERSHSEEKDPAYVERRRKNNEAAKRSRDARRQKEEEIATRAAMLEQENITLKAELILLRRESAELHNLLYGRADTQR